MAIEKGRSRILVIEDDRKLADALRAGIAAEGYDVSVASSAEEGFFLVHNQHPDLLLLDLTLPERNGLDLLRQIRQQQVDLRIMILTSHNSVPDRVEGLRSGADDYLGKPFSFPELTARIDALLRRFETSPPSEVLRIGDLVVNTRERKARRQGESLDLTAREFDVLLYMAEHQGRIVSREMLAKEVWKENSRFSPLDNVIDVQIARLRRKLDDRFPAKLLQTVRGLGFCLRETQD
ncbi:MAG: response regulator transcription factor [Janthinobacterium lividum]